jgi:hypothetical protein
MDSSTTFHHLLVLGLKCCQATISKIYQRLSKCVPFMKVININYKMQASMKWVFRKYNKCIDNVDESLEILFKIFLRDREHV